MCNCRKRFTLGKVRELALKHQKLEMRDVYIFFNGAYNYSFELDSIESKKQIIETIEYK